MPEMNRDEIAKLEALYANNPEGRVFTHLAEAYRKAGDYERARSILEQGLEKHPAYASAHVVLGRVFIDLNEIPQARAAFRHVLELDPHNLVALRSLGELSRLAGNAEEALTYFEELRHQDPSNSEIDEIIAELKQAPASPAAAAEPVFPPAEEPEGGEAGRASSAPTAEVVKADRGPAAGSFEEPRYAATPPAEPLEELPGFENAQPDYGDLVAPDIDLGWTAGAHDDTLPGDLAELAGQTTAEETPEPTFGAEAPQAETPEPEPEPEIVEFEANVEIAEVVELVDVDFTVPGVEAAPEAEIGAFDISDLEQQPEEEPVYEPFSVDLPEQEPPLWAQTSAEAPAVEELPEPEPGPEPIPETSFDTDETPPDDLVTETMAELLVGQGLHEAAADVYRALIHERPWDPDLKQRLAEVEAMGQPSPAASSAEAAEEVPAEHDIEVESPWTSAPSAAASAATPYAWTDESAELEDAGPPIADYFRSLLSWRPGDQKPAAAAPEPQHTAEPEPEVANFEPTPAAANQPAIVELEEPVAPEEAAGTEELMPWEVAEPAPALAPEPARPAAPAPTSSNPVEAAFDEWFNAPEESPGSEPGPAVEEPDQAEGEGEDDDDLEMFRSWLQSLKK